MKPEAQRIAIAEACGVRVKSFGFRYGAKDWLGAGSVASEGYYNESFAEQEARELTFKHSMVCGDIYEHPARLPDYLNDLNAMHEAEKVLPAIKHPGTYGIILEEVAGGWSMTATAAQRAEAFLRTIGKWEDAT